MPSPLLQLRIPQDLADWLEAKHPSRGEVAEYVRQLLTAEQMKEAVAPLVPDSWVPSDSESPSTEAFGYGFRELKAEPKPKARRKKGVKVVVTERGVSPKDIQIPVRCHCKRGMIIGAGPRKGQCTICGNPKPSKESK